MRGGNGVKSGSPSRHTVSKTRRMFRTSVRYLAVCYQMNPGVGPTKSCSQKRNETNRNRVSQYDMTQSFMPFRFTFYSILHGNEDETDLVETEVMVDGEEVMMM